MTHILRENLQQLCTPDEQGLLPLHEACRSGVSLDVLQLLVQCWPDALLWRNGGGSTPLHTACCNQPSAAVIDYLIQQQPKAAAMPNDYGWWPLHAACAYGASRAVVERLGDAYPQACTTATYRYGDTPLHLACFGSHAQKDVVEYLLSLLQSERQDETNNKLHLFWRNKKGEMPLERAMSSNAPTEVIELLQSALTAL